MQEENELSKDLVEATMEHMFNSIFVLSDKISNKKLSVKEELIDDYLRLTQKILTSGFIKSDKVKLQVMDLIDRLNTQKELIELIRNDKSESEITEIAKRLHKRSQSSFE